MHPARTLHYPRNTVLSGLLLLALAGCGGGGGGSGTNTPVANSSTFTTSENTPGSGFFDVDLAPGRTPTYAIVQNGARGTAVVSDQAAGEFTYTPNANTTGSDAFTFRVNDGSRDSNVAVVSVVIVRSRPIAADDAASTDEDASVTIDVLANDAGNGHTIDPASVTLASLPARGGAVIQSDGSITYTPSANANGTDSFTYTVKDDVGSTSNAARVTITIAPVNDPPAAADDDFTVMEDSTNSLAVLANNGHGADADADGDALVITAVGTPDQNGSVGINGAQNGLIYSPAANFFGTETFTYTLSDGQGGTDTAIVTVVVTPVNDAPVAADDDFAVAEDSTTTLTVLADNGHGADADIDGATLTIVGVGLTSQGGTLSLNAGNTALIYTPAADFFGVETFTYTLGDGQGGTDTAVATLTVTPVNDAPSAKDDEFTVAEDSTTPLPVLADNGHGADADIDGDTLAIVSVGAASQGGVAVINGTGDAIIYTPPADFSGTETFSYTLSDGQGGSGNALVTMTVTPVNDAPLARDDAFTVAFNSSGNPLTVLADHGSGADSDADNDPLAITSVGMPSQGGAVAVNGAQDALIYSPAAGFVGVENFSYTISDGNGGSASAAVSVNTAVSDTFNGGAGNWTFVDDGVAASSWSILSGTLRQQNRVGGLDQSYHKGSYAYYTAGTGLTNYRFSVDAIYLDTALADDIGIMFRYANNNNYYRLSMNSRGGFTRLEKKVSGVFTPLAVNSLGYDAGQALDFTVEINGSLIQVWINEDPVFAIEDSDLASGSVALYTQGGASFDNVSIAGNTTDPSVVLGAPVAYTVASGSTLAANAVGFNIPAGGAVEFLLDGAFSIVDSTFPYGASFSSVAQGDHTVEAILRGSANEELARDTNTLVGTLGEYFTALGDSIINGTGDNFASDNQTQRILGFQGFAPNLVGLLESSLGKPVMIYNEGIGGDESVDTAFTRADSILARHPGSNKALVLIGTNDALSGSVPSGSGCAGAACNGTFKGNMQSLINTLTAAGKTVYTALIPPIFGYSTPFSNPATHPVNATYVQQYNTVISSELTGRVVGPDFYAYFLGAGANRFSLFADTWHPNALGHRVMAYLWHNILNPGSPITLPLVLANLSRTTASPYLKQNLLEVGDAYYTDRTYTLSNIPPAFADAVWVMTANDDTGNTSSSYLTFDVDRAVTVYIAYDAGATTLPNWMSSFTDTGLSVNTTDPLSPTLDLYSKAYSAGSVTLGGNMATGASGVNSHYLVIVVPN